MPRIKKSFQVESVFPRIAVTFIAAAAAAAFLATFCTSCAVRPPVGAAGQKAPCPSRTIDLLRKESPALNSVKATVDAYITTGQPPHNEKVQIGLVAQRPDKIRLNIYSGFIHVVSVGADGDSLWAFLPPFPFILAGAIDDAASQVLLPASTGVLIDAVRSILFPDGFCLNGCETEIVSKGRCRFEEESEEGTEVGIVETKTGRLRSLSFSEPDGRETAVVKYSNYRQSGGMYFPGEVTLSLPSDHISLRMVFNRVALNRHIDESVFRLKDMPIPNTKGFNEIPK